MAWRRGSRWSSTYGGCIAKDEASVDDGGATRWWLKVKVPGWTVEEDRWQRRIRVTLPVPS
jgi:hypothetical protein